MPARSDIVNELLGPTTGGGQCPHPIDQLRLIYEVKCKKKKLPAGRLARRPAGLFGRLARRPKAMSVNLFR